MAFGDVAPHVYEIDQSVGSSMNQAILLNIVRASRSEPLYFTSVSQVSGSGNADLKTGLPNIVVGAPSPSTLTFTNGADNSESTNFQVGVLNSSDFYKGLLTPINLPEASLLIHQGFSREMVFSVLVDRGRIHSGNTVREILNKPGDKSYAEFEKDLHLAIDSGITVETFKEANPDTPSGGGKGGGAQNSAPAFITEGKPCFDQALANSAYFADLARRSPAACSETLQPKTVRKGKDADLSFPIGGEKESFEVVLRSPYQVFQYLGNMLSSDAAERVMVGGDDAEAKPLMMVSSSPSASPCFTDINYGGAYYCIPDKGSERTRQAFSLLNQILALNTSTADLPTTNNVLITQ